jgi:glycosyltransferase involved in cell wall biosynthesis
MEPIAKSIAALGHEVHVVAPWHPLVSRHATEDGVRFHFYRYAPLGSLNVFGYAAALRADVSLRAAAYMAAPLAMAAGWRTVRRVAQQCGASIMHGHWVIPGGALAAASAPALPLVVSLHGSDVYVAERMAVAGRIARTVFRRSGRITACSPDLARRAVSLGADASRLEVVPYGVDVSRFRPDPVKREATRNAFGIKQETPLVFAAGRLVRKKGFEYLVDAIATLGPGSPIQLALAGDGDLAGVLRARASAAGLVNRVRFLGNLTQDAVSSWLAAADIIAVPSVRDDSGNVDGLPNVVLEAMASGTPLVTTAAGGIGSVVEDGRTALVVPERDVPSLLTAITTLASDPALRHMLGMAARRLAASRFGWNAAAKQFEAAYEHALALKSVGR